MLPQLIYCVYGDEDETDLSEMATHGKLLLFNSTLHGDMVVVHRAFR